jgi:hypothetical protein
VRGRGFSTPIAAAESYFGPADFWAELRELRASIPPPRDHFAWPEWDAFWAIAQRHGMLDYEPHPDDSEAAKSFRYGAIGAGLARQFLRVKNAREEGIDAYRFHLRELKAIHAEEQAERARVERERRERLERIRREEEVRKNKGGVRHFKPRSVVRDDDEVAL